MNLETAAVGLVARVAPWMAPIPTAWLIYDRTTAHLHWPAWVGVAAGVTLECLGLTVMATMLQLWSYNRERRKSEPRAALVLPVVLILVYFASAEGLTVVLGWSDGWASLAPAVFPFLSLVAMASLALRVDHARRLEENTRIRQEAREERKARKEEAERLRESQPVTVPVTPANVPEKTQTWRSFLELHPAMLEMTGKQIAEIAGVTERTGNNWKQAARNGGGNHERT